MKRKMKEKEQRADKQKQTPAKGSIQALSDYFGSYLNALEIVTARQ